jgi:copper chaperone CopZ
MDTTTQFKIDGMTCASCAGRVEKTLHKVVGVTDVTVNLATDTATIQGTASYSELIAAVIEAGYQVPVKVK